MSAVSSAVEAAITGPAMVSARLTVVQQEDLRRRLVPSRSERKSQLSYAIKTRQKAINAPSWRLSVLGAVSLWHKTAGVSNISISDLEFRVDQSA